jgi:hypothetical protein
MVDAGKFLNFTVHEVAIAAELAITAGADFCRLSFAGCRHTHHVRRHFGLYRAAPSDVVGAGCLPNRCPALCRQRCIGYSSVGLLWGSA